jgi:hypothetical protein
MNPFSSCTTTTVTIVDPDFYTAEQMKTDNQYWEELFAKITIAELNEAAYQEIELLYPKLN